jgi:hypothetical protein
MLWYRALIGRAIFNLPPEPQDYAYIPDDLIQYLHPLSAVQITPIGRPASPAECAHPILATDHIIDHTCTLLAALRMNASTDEIVTPGWSMSPQHLGELLRAAGLVDYSGFPLPDTVRPFLETGRGEALAQIAGAWMRSETFNELRLLPGLKFEGEWVNNPLQTRQSVLEMLSQLPQGAPGGVYPRLLLVCENGAQIFSARQAIMIPGSSEKMAQRLICVVSPVGMRLMAHFAALHHYRSAALVGMMDLAAPGPKSEPAAFRLSAWAASLWHGNPPEGLPIEKEPVRVTSDGRLILTSLSPRWVRYQVARFCQWEGETKGEYRYRIVPSSLEQAQQQGLRPAHLLALLRKFAAGPLPPDLRKALEGWEKFGVQANIEPVILLRVSSPEILDALRKTRAARDLGEVLSPTTVLIKPGRAGALRSALAECGYLTEVKLGEI